MIHGFGQSRVCHIIASSRRCYCMWKPRTQEQYIIHNNKRKLDSQKSDYIIRNDPVSSILGKKILNANSDNSDTSSHESQVNLQDHHNSLIKDLNKINGEEACQSVAFVENKNFKAKSQNKGLLISKIEEALINENTVANTEIPVTNVPCAGCGALLHCQEISRPGFLSSIKLELALQDRSIARSTICLRCDRLSKHLDALEEKVISYEEYCDVLSVIKKRQGKATVILVADMLDLPGSIVPNIYQLTEANKYFLVGNKADMIPRDREIGWNKHWSHCLLKYAEQCGIPDVLIKDIRFVSGKTGFGIEELIDSLYTRPSTSYPVYIVGCTNVGKSTIFNRLIQSDFCKSIARDYIHRSTISAWPGTTIDLVKFPIQRYGDNFKEQRFHELLQRKKEKSKLLKKGDLPAYYQKLKGVVEPTNPTTSRKVVSKHQDLSKMATYSYDPNSVTLVSSEYDEDMVKDEFVKWEEFDERVYSDNSWCYDTPGYVNKNQLVNYLSVDELEVLYNSYNTWLPRTFILKPGLSLLVSSLGRIDLLQGDKPVYFTSHTPLPIHIVETNLVEDYLQEMLPHLLLPLPDQTRPNPLPPLTSPGEFKIKGRVVSKPVGDIVLSSLGWVSVSCEESIIVQAFTPGGIGCRFRTPCLLPLVISMKGKRIFGTREFSIKKIKK